MLRAILNKVATILDAILKIRNCSMMTRWHHSDSSKARSAEHDSVKKKTLDLSSRSKWFSAGLIHVNKDSKKEGSEYPRHHSGESAQFHFPYAAAAKFLHPKLKDLLL